mgnify:CR=1 FL=1
MPGRIIFWAAPLLVPVLFFIVWESMATLVGNSLILPPLEEIGALLAHPLDNVIAMGTLAGNIGISLVRVLCGYAAAVLLGVPLGVAMGYYAGLHRLLNLFLGMFRPIPPLAWIPLSILWFGLGDKSKFFIIFLGCFTFITVNTYDGAKNVDPELMGAARMLGASERQVFFRIVLPSSVPYIFAGLQIAVTAGWSAVVGAEMVRSDEGVGWMIVRGMNTGNTLQIMVGMVAIGIVGFLLATLTSALERRLCA